MTLKISLTFIKSLKFLLYCPRVIFSKILIFTSIIKKIRCFGVDSIYKKSVGAISQELGREKGNNTFQCTMTPIQHINGDL